jgi:hypothetical protein
MGLRAKAGILGALVLVLVAFAGPALCGTLNDPAAPTDENSAMYTIDNVYDRINNGTSATKRAGAFTEPSAGPASIGHTLTELYDLASERSRRAKTGQTASYATGDDGYLGKGVTWPSTRFTDNSNGTVTDNLTGLIWLKNANCPYGNRNWSTALSDVTSLNSAGTMNGNNCGDTSNGGNHQTDWRLPNRNELRSLVDLGQYNPALPSGHPFSGVQSSPFWSSTTYAGNPGDAWYLDFYSGFVFNHGKTSYTYYVWPVRGGQ